MSKWLTISLLNFASAGTNFYLLYYTKSGTPLNLIWVVCLACAIACMYMWTQETE